MQVRVSACRQLPVRQAERERVTEREGGRDTARGRERRGGAREGERDKWGGRGGRKEMKKQAYQAVSGGNEQSAEIIAVHHPRALLCPEEGKQGGSERGSEEGTEGWSQGWDGERGCRKRCIRRERRGGKDRWREDEEQVEKGKIKGWRTDW